MNISRFVSASLATSLATLTLLAGNVRIAHADDSPPPPPPPPVATVEVRSPAQGVVMGYVTERLTAVSSTGAFAAGLAWKDQCTAPCRFDLAPGFHELIATGEGYVGGTERFDLHAGTNRFVVKPGNAAIRWSGGTLAVVGGLALIGGVVVAAVGLPSTDRNGISSLKTPGWAVPMAIGGGAVLAGGITMTALSSTAIERDADPQGASALRARVTGLSLGGTF
jgi:hypothetical protein